MKIAVITPSLPARSKMLGEAIESVKSQALQPHCHLIAVGLGRSVARNVMAKAAYFDLGCDWLAFLDDDDLLLPNHLELLAAAAGEGTDLIYSRCEAQAEDGVGHPDTSSWRRPWSATVSIRLPARCLRCGWSTTRFADMTRQRGLRKCG